MSGGVTRRGLGKLLLGAAAVSALPTGALAAVDESAQTAAKAAALRKLVAEKVAKDPPIAAAFLRMAFHDAFTYDLETGLGGANGSIRFEMDRGESSGALPRAMDVLKVMQRKTGLGWGDTIAVAGAAAVEATGGPAIDVPLGRPNASKGDPTGILPNPDMSVADLRKLFAPRGFDDTDIVALSGAHTLGISTYDGPFVAEPNKFKNEYVLRVLSLGVPVYRIFEFLTRSFLSCVPHSYFQNLMYFKGRKDRSGGAPSKPNYQLKSDLALVEDPKTAKIVKKFADNQQAFFDAFAKSYIKCVAVGASFAPSS